MQWRSRQIIWCLATAACGGATATVSAQPDEAGVVSDAGIDPDARADASPLFDAGLAACDGESPSTSEACNTALTARCRAFGTERDCQSADIVEIEENARYVCAWNKVTTFSEVATCAVASIVGRCDAYYVFPGRRGCAAYPNASVLVEKNGSSRAGATDGPIDRNWLFEVQRTEPRESYECGAGLLPPAPPICECTAACRQ